MRAGTCVPPFDRWLLIHAAPSWYAISSSMNLTEPRSEHRAAVIRAVPWLVQFMDATSMDIRALKKSCIHFATPEGEMIPFETYNLFYRQGKRALLTEIRDNLRSARNTRRAQAAKRERRTGIALTTVAEQRED